MSNAELIAEARSVVLWNVTDEITGPNDDLLTMLADALEEAERNRSEIWWEGHLAGLKDAYESGPMGAYMTCPYDA